MSTPVDVTFDEDMNPSTITTSTMKLACQNTGDISGTVTYDASTKKATFTPSSSLPNSAVCSTILTSGMTTVAGVSLTEFSCAFVTQASSTVAQTVTLIPTNNATGVSLSQIITATFTQTMDSSSITDKTFLLTSLSGPITGTVTCNTPCVVATFTPSAPLANSTEYTIALTTGIRSFLGISLNVPIFSTFLTAP